MTITKKLMEKVVREKLKTNAVWAVRAMVKVYTENQTESEKSFDATIEENGIGFSGCDANILSAFARCAIDGKSLSQKQMAVVFKLMPKYTKQVIRFSDKEKLMKICEQEAVKI